MSVKVELHATDDHGNVLTLMEELEVVWRGHLLRVPAGFKSDGASVPRFLWASVSPAVDNRTIRAAIAHDYLYRTHPEGWSRKDADELFYDLCREDGLGWYPAQKAYWGVRLFGGAAWNEGGVER